MDSPQVFKTKIQDPVALLDVHIMETVRPRRKTIWTMYNRKINNTILNPFDLNHSGKLNWYGSIN